MDSFSYTGSAKGKVKRFKKFKLKDTFPMGEHSKEDISNSGNSCNCCTRFQEVVLGGLETFFYNYGKFVSR